ncbi:MAG: aldo/keto reductase [Chromatiales bacterium]|nr:aldo/keto reductase [Chromatiales bacterium]
MNKNNPATAAAAGTITIGGDLNVNRLGFGAMRVTGAGVWGEPGDPDEARRVLREAVALGCNFIDTADSYGPGVSERLIRETLQPYTEGLVIATKGGLVRPGPQQFHPRGTPEHLRKVCAESLDRLGLERIDLYQFHFPDPEVPIRESLGEIRRLQQAGRIRHIGVSNFDLEQLKEARELVDVVSVQNRYSLETRRSDPVLEYCEREGIAFIPWYPLEAGRHAGSDPAALPGALAAVAETHGVKPVQVVIAWLLARSPVMLPIPGTSSVEHLRENVAAASLRLSNEDIAKLDAAAH